MLDLAAGTQLPETTGQLVHDLFFPAAQAVEVDGRGSEIDTIRLGTPGFVEQVGHMQERFGRDASAVQADTAGIFLRIHQGYLQAQVGREKSRGIATRAGTDYH